MINVIVSTDSGLSRTARKEPTTVKILLYLLGFCIAFWATLVFFSALYVVLLQLSILLYYLTAPLWYPALVITSVLSYPVVWGLRKLGYRCPTLYKTWELTRNSRWHELKTSFDLFNRSSRQQTYHRDRDATKEARSSRTEGQQQESARSKISETKRAPSAWQILGIPQGSSREVIIRAYRQKMMQNHPDKVATLDPAFQDLANRRALLIQKAFKELVPDPQASKRYGSG